MLNPAAMIAVILTLIVLVIIFRVVRKPKRPQQIEIARENVLQPAEKPLSVVEQCCLQTLQQVAGSEFNVRSKIKLREIAASQGQTATQLLDFVLFSKSDNKPECVLQLQSPSMHDENEMELSLKRAEIPLYRLPRKSSYSPMKMRQRLKQHIETEPPSPDEMIATISMKAFRLCDRCQSPMDLKRASAGPHKGMLFWVCQKHPHCQNVILYTE